MYDVIVVGGGHAGCEAAAVAARLGSKTCLITFDANALAKMSCNPAIGGVAKGQLVREIDALGGIMSHVADRAGINFRILNASRGPAVRSPRTQADRELYSIVMREILTATPNLDILEGEGTSLLTKNGECCGVIANSRELFAKSIIITSGTFLNAIMHFGMETVSGGRIDDKTSVGLSEYLRENGFSIGRLKTGTPARIRLSTIDTSNMEEHLGDDPPQPFSYHPQVEVQNKITCYLTRTSQQTHDIIMNNLDRSPLYTGKISGVGPRYCPSIEDKIKRFPDKDSHQVFIEPEGINSDLAYPNGISTSLPIDVQQAFINSIPGLERAEIVQPGYAVEYDFSNPQDLYPWLESKRMKGLFMAGQINGTSGYEEAAAQGLMAGINAALRVRDDEPFILGRDEAYIGVLIDDLVTKGTEEPYRLFTSSAEHRLLLRQDNADFRLTEKAYNLGMVPREWSDEVQQWKASIAKMKEALLRTYITPSDSVRDTFKELNLGEISQPTALLHILRRAHMKACDLGHFGFNVSDQHPRALEQLEIETKYEGYIERQLKQIDQDKKADKRRVPMDLDYPSLVGLRREACEKFERVRPTTIGQASRIPGIVPADINVLWVSILKHQRDLVGE